MFLSTLLGSNHLALTPSPVQILDKLNGKLIETMWAAQVGCAKRKGPVHIRTTKQPTQESKTKKLQEAVRAAWHRASPTVELSNSALTNPVEFRGIIHCWQFPVPQIMLGHKSTMGLVAALPPQSFSLCA